MTWALWRQNDIRDLEQMLIDFQQNFYIHTINTIYNIYTYITLTMYLCRYIVLYSSFKIKNM